MGGGQNRLLGPGLRAALCSGPPQCRRSGRGEADQAGGRPTGVARNGLPPRPRDWARRHGHGVSRARCQARSVRRAQTLECRAHRVTRRGALSARDGTRGAAPASPRPHGARFRRDAVGAVVVHDAVRRGRKPSGPTPPRATDGDRGRATDHPGGGRRARVRSRPWHRAPRCEAGQYPAVGRACVADGFRHRGQCRWEPRRQTRRTR